MTCRGRTHRLVSVERRPAWPVVHASTAPDPRSLSPAPPTAQAILLPMAPPYTSAQLLVSGGTSTDFAKMDTPASVGAHVIELMGGEQAGWRDVGPMPHPRVMGDAVHLCDGTILYVGGSAVGTAVRAVRNMATSTNRERAWERQRACADARIDFMLDVPRLHTGLQAAKDARQIRGA